MNYKLHDENLKYYVWFSRLELNNYQKLMLIKLFKKIENIWNASEEILKKFKIKKNVIKEVLNNKYKIGIDKEIMQLKMNNINMIYLKENTYPVLLKRIKNPPIFLFVKGNVENLNNKNIISMVGSRDCSNYGKEVAKYFATNLSKRKVCIISGLARGIDKYSHLGAYKEIGRTIAVMGCGIDICYPYENQKLYEEILKNDGTIISEYKIGVQPKKEQFPERNRIISGISKALIVIEAKERSGTFITVNYALAQGKDVYAVPGNINSIYSKGTNILIKEGAIPLSSIEDINLSKY